MANRVNLKVSGVTHEAIKAEQKGDETIDDTLQRVLGLTASINDVEHGIASYLDDNQREQVDELVSLIRDLGGFEETIEEGGGTAGSNVHRFVAEDSGLTIATMECSEDGYIVHYRDKEGDLNNVFSTVYDAEDANMDRIRERVRERVEGALRRWGDRSTSE